MPVNEFELSQIETVSKSLSAKVVIEAQSLLFLIETAAVAPDVFMALLRN